MIVHTSSQTVLPLLLDAQKSEFIYIYNISRPFVYSRLYTQKETTAVGGINKYNLVQYQYSTVQYGNIDSSNKPESMTPR